MNHEWNEMAFASADPSPTDSKWKTDKDSEKAGVSSTVLFREQKALAFSIQSKMVWNSGFLDDKVEFILNIRTKWKLFSFKPTKNTGSSNARK